MSDEAFLEIVYHGREERNLEYKQSISWQESAAKVKVAKSVMARARRRNSLISLDAAFSSPVSTIRSHTATSAPASAKPVPLSAPILSPTTGTNGYLTILGQINDTQPASRILEKPSFAW